MADPNVDVRQAAEAYRLHREGLSQRAIAEALGCAQSTVSAHIRRGRAAQEAVALHDIAEQRNDSSGLLVELRDRLWALWDTAASVPEVTKLSREIRSIESQRARLLGLDMPTQLAITQDRPAPTPNAALAAAIAKVCPPASAEDLARAAELQKTDPALFEAVYDYAHQELGF